jgi:hypothetical protein
MHRKIYKKFHTHYKTKYEGIYKNAKKLFVFDLFLLFGSICLLGASLFFFFWKPTIVDLIDVNFSLRAERILAGDEISIAIDYKNRSKHKLEDVVLAVHLPSGFLVDREKTPLDIFSLNSTANIGSLDPGATGNIVIYGRYFARPMSDEKITAYFSYRPEDKKNKEQKISGAFIKTVGSNLKIEMELADSTLANHSLPFKINLQNTGELPLTDIYFASSTMELVFDQPETVKNILLKPGEQMEFNGRLQAPASIGEYSVAFSAFTVVNNTPVEIAEFKKNINVFYPEIKSGIKLLFDKEFADGSDTLPLRVYWNNSGNYQISNPRLRFAFTPGVVDLYATARENNMTVSGNELIADKKTRTSFFDGTPGVSDEFEINLKLLPFFKTDGQKILEIKVIAEAVLPENQEQKFSIESAEKISIKLATQANWQIRPVYYTAEGDQLGRGPLPPEVGETTKYWIFVEVNNGLNPIENNYFSATLGDGVEFTGKESVTIGSKFNHDKGDNSISWNHYSIPANSSVGLYFEVAVTPTASQTGKKIILIKNAQYNAKDNEVNKQINLNYGQIDNTLSKDDRGSEYKAQVQP